jgi:hypothetical protein
MNLAPSVLGSYAVKRLQETADETILVVGRDTLGRKELAAVGCYNFTAARNLSAVLKPLQLPSLKHLFDHIPPASLALPHMGVVSLAVLGAAFEARKIGGGSPLLAWVKSHAAGGDEKRAMVTFHTLKVREAQDHAGEKQAIEQRKRRRKGKAHGLRLARFTARQQSAAS